MVISIDKNAPLSQVLKKEYRQHKKSWITKGNLNFVKTKNTLLKIFLNTKQNFYYERYKFYRNQINHLVRKNIKIVTQSFLMTILTALELLGEQ